MIQSRANKPKSGSRDRVPSKSVGRTVILMVQRTFLHLLVMVQVFKLCSAGNCGCPSTLSTEGGEKRRQVSRRAGGVLKDMYDPQQGQRPQSQLEVICFDESEERRAG